MEIRNNTIIGQGNTAEIYKLDNNRILKLFRTGLNKSVVEREYQNGIIVQKILGCVPKVYEMVDVNGRWGIVYEEIAGKDLLKIILVSLWRINDYSKELAHYHFDIHRPVNNSLYSVKDKLLEDLDNVNILSEEYKETIRNYLGELPDGNRLCHFDFHPGNIMIAESRAIFLDWMTACRGDACADVARTSILLKHGEVPHVPWIMRKLISIFQHHIYKIYIKEYLLISKRRIEDIDEWELPVAAARLREWISENEKKILKKIVTERCCEIMKKV